MVSLSLSCHIINKDSIFNVLFVSFSNVHSNVSERAPLWVHIIIAFERNVLRVQKHKFNKKNNPNQQMQKYQ